mmetsp:Transcript_15089/g.32232  ORF Transcript_15089/g.32232 Transcript_15089/m.32232 type:complete len:200 (+) Transcript_15089:732-1331(+)
MAVGGSTHQGRRPRESAATGGHVAAGGAAQGEDAARDGRLGDGAVLQHLAMPLTEGGPRGAQRARVQGLHRENEAAVADGQAKEAAQAAAAGADRHADALRARDDDAPGRGVGGGLLGGRHSAQLGPPLPETQRVQRQPALRLPGVRGARRSAGQGLRLPGDGRTALQDERQARVQDRRVGIQRQVDGHALPVPGYGGL